MRPNLRLLARYPLRLLLLAGAIIPRAGLAQPTNPAYLAQFPSTRQVREGIKGSDPVDSSARVMAAWTWLREIIRTLSGPRYASMQYTPDENRVSSEYGSVWQRGLYLQNLPPEKDRARWDQLRAAYEKDPGFLDQLLQRFFSADFRTSYYRAIGKPAPGVVAARPVTSPSPTAAPAPAPPTAARPSARPSAPPRIGTAAWHLAEGDRLKTAKEYAKAIESYQSAIRLDPASARAHAELAFCYYILERYQNALPEYQTAVKLAPDDVATRTLLAATHYYLGNHDSAQSELMEVKRRKADYAPPHFWLGMVFWDLEQFSGAVASFQEAIRLDPKVANYQLQLGLTYVDMGRKEDALTVVGALKKLDPARAARLSKEIDGSFAPNDNAEDNLLLARSYSDTLLAARTFALRALRRVIVLKPSPDTLAEAYAWISMVYQEEEDYQKAAAANQEAIRLDPRDPDHHLRLGLTYLAMGQKGKALEVLRTLQALDKAKAQQLTAAINKMGR